jgi:hypothetical protein
MLFQMQLVPLRRGAGVGVSRRGAVPRRQPPPALTTRVGVYGCISCQGSAGDTGAAGKGWRFSRYFAAKTPVDDTTRYVNIV